MFGQHRQSIAQLEEPRTRSRCASLANELSLLDLLKGDRTHFQPVSYTLAPVNTNLYARRHSAHNCPTTEYVANIPPPLPARPPAVPKRMHPPAEQVKTIYKATISPLPPPPRTRVLPPIPPADIKKKIQPDHIKYERRTQGGIFDFGSDFVHEYRKIPPAPIGPPPPIPKSFHKTPVSPVPKPVTQQTNNKVSVRQDSNVSSDSFSQTSSPSYTSKTMETPLLPHRTPIKFNNATNKNQNVETDANGNTPLTKSVSTPASLQAIVRFHNGSNMSLHHKIIRDIRRPSSHYVRRMRMPFRLIQLVLNALALLAIGGGMAIYFRAYPNTLQLVNTTVNVSYSNSAVDKTNTNPAPGICLPVIVNFCQQHKVPYNYTVFPNYMGHFGQRDAQQELEVYDAVVDVRCYELAALFLCSLFVPKCGPGGVVVRPCRSLCFETKRRCGFFLDVFGLALPNYLECGLFPESTDPEICVGNHEVKQAKLRSQKFVCPTGFQCDGKRCIPKHWQCDGHVDCKDQTDEINCEKCRPGTIRCGANHCMAQEHMCDGKLDCPSGQDERNCLRLSERNGDEGRGQLEVFRPDNQKWVPACVSQWDQVLSPSSVCSLLGYSNSSGGLLIKGTNANASRPIHETTAIWRMHQNKRPKNLLREFGSCTGTSYSTVNLTCTNYNAFRWLCHHLQYIYSNAFRWLCHHVQYIYSNAFWWLCHHLQYIYSNAFRWLCHHLQYIYSKCGKVRKSYAETRSLRIVGGVVSKPGDWPFLAALLGGPEEIFYCAGVLIADQWVLTASHCVGNHSDVSGWTIQLGLTRRRAHSFYGQKMKVKRVVPHPMYNLGIAHDNDVALFQLSSHVTFHEHLLPVCLPPANKELPPGTKCIVIGWGKKEDTTMSEYEPEVNEVEVPVLNRDICNGWLENRDLNVTEGMICAGYEEGGKDACQGDSGGPLLCRDKEDPDRWFVGGIVSWGIKCAHPRLPGVYAYVPKYVPWILQQITQYSD